MNSYDRSYGMRMYVHDILFHESIWAQGTSEQYNKWKVQLSLISNSMKSQIYTIGPFIN